MQQVAVTGRIVRGITITAGPTSVTGLQVGVGFKGPNFDDALLGQNYLRKFDITIAKDQMVLRKKSQP